jgi:hypothetical protein
MNTNGNIAQEDRIMKLQNNNSFGVAVINALESSILNTEYFPHRSEVLCEQNKYPAPR